jgi:hypothetical protein
MKKIIFFILVLILTACGAAAQTAAPATRIATISPTNTSTVTATFTTSPTFTPTITFTPIPIVELPAKVIKAIETDLRGYKICNGDQLCDANDNVLPTYRVVSAKSDTSWILTGTRNFTLEGEEYSYVNILTSKDVTILKDGGLDMQAEQFIDGQLVQEKLLDPNGKPTEYDRFAYNDAVVAIMKETERVIAEEGGLEEDRMSTPESVLLLGFDSAQPNTARINNIIKYHGMEYDKNDWYELSITISLVGVDGINIKKQPTILYTYDQMERKQSVVAFRRNGLIMKMVVDANLGPQIKFFKQVVLSSQ